MTDGRGKADGFTPLAEFDPVGDDVANEFRLVHALGEFTFYIVAVPDVNTIQIGIDGGIHPGRNQKSLLNQLADLRTLDHGLEDAAETTIVPTARRGSQTEENGIWIAPDDRSVALRHD